MFSNWLKYELEKFNSFVCFNNNEWKIQYVDLLSMISIITKTWKRKCLVIRAHLKLTLKQKLKLEIKKYVANFRLKHSKIGK